MKNILILEDHPDTQVWLREAVRDVFADAEISVHATVESASEHLSNAAVNLAILDINLPDGNGVDFAQEVLTLNPSTYVIIASIYDDDRHLFRALQVGVNGYLLKDQKGEEIREKLRNIIKGEPPLSPAIARKMLRYFSMNGQKTESTEPSNLTQREKEVLARVAKGDSRKEIARELGITPHTTAGYIKNIYRKLSISSRSQAALEANRLGLL